MQAKKSEITTVKPCDISDVSHAHSDSNERKADEILRMELDEYLQNS